MAKSVRERVEKHRKTLRKTGLRLVQIWVPDTHKVGFTAECRRQSKRVAKADVVDQEVLDLMDDTLSDIDGWTA